MNACIGDCLHLKSNLYSRLWLSSSSTSTTKRDGNEHKVQRKPNKTSLTIYDTHFTFIFLSNLIATDRSCLLRAYVCVCVRVRLNLLVSTIRIFGAKLCVPCQIDFMLVHKQKPPIIWILLSNSLRFTNRLSQYNLSKWISKEKFNRWYCNFDINVWNFYGFFEHR